VCARAFHKVDLRDFVANFRRVAKIVDKCNILVYGRRR